MIEDYVIGLDLGSESARGVLINVGTATVEASYSWEYTHGVMVGELPDGTPLSPFWALQNALDYTQATEAILERLGRGRVILGIGIGCTASTPLPALEDGTPLSERYPEAPHAYVKLWKHAAAQPWADEITAKGGHFLSDYGGRLSANTLLARAAEMAAEAPDLWAETERFIEAGDWVAWQLTGVEKRSFSFAAYKAHYNTELGYPSDIVQGLTAKLGAPHPIGTPVGRLSATWLARTGIEGTPLVAMPVIDSHVVMPAAGAVSTGTLVGALGTSAVFLLLDDQGRPLPKGIEGMARDGVLPGFWCYEAGQASFGDTLAWFVRNFPLAPRREDNFALYNQAAARLRAGENRLIALDWWNGCRVPHADSLLNGMIVGMTLQTTPVHLYRALLDSLCFGARSIMEHLLKGGATIDKVVLTSGLSLSNPELMQLMADVLGNDIHVPQESHLTAIGAAIHATVAIGLAADYDEAAGRFGARDFLVYRPDPAATLIYDTLYDIHRALETDPGNRQAMHGLSRLL
jgi:L-ribulokinase